MLRPGPTAWSGDAPVDLQSIKWKPAEAARPRVPRVARRVPLLSMTLAAVGATLVCTSNVLAVMAWLSKQYLPHKTWTDAAAARNCQWNLANNATSCGMPAPQRFAHVNTPVTAAAGVAGLNAGSAGLGCSFRRCVTGPGGATRGMALEDSQSRSLASLPYTYVLIPFRNRLDNLARLLTSINNATTPEQRACVCALVVDFGTTLEAMPPWKNPRCLGTMHATYNMYMYPMEALRRQVALDDAVSNLRPDDCPTNLYTNEYGTRSLRDLPYPAYITSSMAPHHLIRLPMHVNVEGRHGADALHYIVSLYDGESLVINGNTITNATFSRAGAIQAGLNAIHTPANKSLVFVCDADMIVRPGFFLKMWMHTLPAKQVYLPICWAMCYGAGMDSLPQNDTVHLSAHARYRVGFWHHAGAGMVAAYVSDLRAVGGLQELKDKADWGREDGVLLGKLRRKFDIHRKNTSELVHMYHPRMSDWTSSRDGMLTGHMELAGLARYVCTGLGPCGCPLGTSATALAATVGRLVRSCDESAGLAPTAVAACNVLTNWTRANAKVGTARDLLL